MSKLGINKDDQKKANRGLALKLIATGACRSRIELSRRTGLTKTAISHIVNDFLQQNVLEETSLQNRQGTGKSPMGLAVSPKMKKIVGILIQRGYCEAVLCDIQLNILRYERVDMQLQTADELIFQVCALADRMMQTEEEIIGIGCASIGPVSVKEGRIIQPLHFNQIQDIPIASILQERYGIPVCFDHDNQSAVLAEYYFGNERGYQDIFLVSVGRGVGCGVVVDGHRIHSYTGYAPEIGHVSIDSRGPACQCGNNGCVECYINSVDVRERMKRATGLDLSYREFCARTDLKEIREILEDITDKLLFALLNTLNILNSQIILLCMDCIYWPDVYIERLEREINRKKFGNRGILVPVRKVRFLEKTQVLGSAANVLSRLFKGELIM